MQHFSHAGHTLTWEEHSPGAHTFIVIHGYSANRAIWGRELKLLAERGRCVTLDLPGHYPAQAPAGYRSLNQELLIELETGAIEQIAGGGQVTLIGHSTGGLVALAVAARRPDLVARVVTISGVVWGPLSGWLGHYQRLLRYGGYPLYWLNYRLSQLSPAYIQWGIGLIYSGDRRAYAQNQLAAAAVRAWHPTYRQSRIANFAVLLRMLEGCDIRDLARQVRCPVLAVCGRRDPVVSVDQSRWLAAELPQTTLLEIARAGHLVHWEAAEEVEGALLAWLALRMH